MRVALLTPAYWPEVRRGTERMVHDLATGMAAVGHTPRIVTSHASPPEHAEEGGVRITRLWRPPARLLAGTGAPAHSTHVPGSLTVLTAARPEVAHAFYPTDAVAAGLWARASGRPAVFSIMGIPTRQSLTSTARGPLVWRRAVDSATAVVALSRVAAEATRCELGVEARVIHPGVDLQAFRRVAPRAEQPTIVCMSALEDPRKRVGLLLEAFRRVRRQRRTARLVLNRPADPLLALQAASVSPGIELRDPIREPGGFSALYSQAWVSAMTSTKEAFGLVCVEAMACGTPAVGREDGGAAEIIDSPAVGRVFDGDDPETVERALLGALELATDPETESRCRSRAEDFSVERMVGEHLALYQELLER